MSSELRIIRPDRLQKSKSRDYFELPCIWLPLQQQPCASTSTCLRAPRRYGLTGNDMCEPQFGRGGGSTRSRCAAAVPRGEPKSARAVAGLHAVVLRVDRGSRSAVAEGVCQLPVRSTTCICICMDLRARRQRAISESGWACAAGERGRGRAFGGGP